MLALLVTSLLCELFTMYKLLLHVFIHCGYKWMNFYESVQESLRLFVQINDQYIKILTSYCPKLGNILNDPRTTTWTKYLFWFSSWRGVKYSISLLIF